MIVNLHARHTPNIGDLASPPALYFPTGATLHDVDYQITDDAKVILGGGGLLRDVFIDNLRRIAGRAKRLVIWGVGAGCDSNPSIPDWLGKRALVGCRDVGEGHWIPCASCMSPAFDRQYEIRHEYVVYRHIRKPLANDRNYPAMTNCEPRTIDEAVAFLGSGETIITNSYHGAYWGILLGRRVICHPWNVKFFLLKHPPAYWTGPGIAHPEALEECRAANRAFASTAMDFLA